MAEDLTVVASLSPTTTAADGSSVTLWADLSGISGALIAVQPEAESASSEDVENATPWCDPQKKS